MPAAKKPAAKATSAPKAVPKKTAKPAATAKKTATKPTEKKQASKKGELKTKVNEASVDAFIAQAGAGREDECETIIRIMQRVTGEPPKMWGPSIIGFGKYHYKYDSGHEGDMCVTGFSPRKGNLSIYVLADYPEQDALLERLGKFKAGKACLYVKTLKDIDVIVLEEMVKASVAHVRKRYPDKS